MNRDKDIPERMGGMYRRYRRERVEGLSCDIADGMRLVGGKIEDVSANGFKITQVDDSFIADGFIYQTIVSGDGQHYKMLAKPCWQRNTPAGVEIGFKIIDASWEWTEFILQNVPEPEADFDTVGNA